MLNWVYLHPPKKDDWALNSIRRDLRNFSAFRLLCQALDSWSAMLDMQAAEKPLKVEVRISDLAFLNVWLFCLILWRGALRGCPAWAMWFNWPVWEFFALEFCLKWWALFKQSLGNNSPASGTIVLNRVPSSWFEAIYEAIYDVTIRWLYWSITENQKPTAWVPWHILRLRLSERESCMIITYFQVCITLTPSPAKIRCFGNS